ncbi:hypothetical protein CsSME_00042102 [Camellia sinensis var. sinensis]
MKLSLEILISRCRDFLMFLFLTHCNNINYCFSNTNILYLREDKQFFVDHPGVVPITTAQSLQEKPNFLSFKGRGVEKADWSCCLQ